MNISDDIRVYFASEAWDIFLSYLESLKKAMEKNNVNSEKQGEVIDGIIDNLDIPLTQDIFPCYSLCRVKTYHARNFYNIFS